MTQQLSIIISSANLCLRVMLRSIYAIDANFLNFS